MIKTDKTTGRKCKLTPEMMNQIETLLQNLTSLKRTCMIVGIEPSTFYRWMEQGKAAAGGPKREFCNRVKRAQSMAIISTVAKINADPSWQAKAWLLERQFPEEFGRRQLIAHAGPDGESPLSTGTPINVVIKMTSAGESPWTYAAEQDPEPSNGSDPWETEHPTFDGDIGTQAAGPAAAAPTPRSSLPQAHPMDTGGRPRDPDDWCDNQ